MFLLDFSLYFFKVNASTKLGFFNAQYLTLGEEKEYSQIPICIFFLWVFLALDLPCDLCVCAAGTWSCSCIDMLSLLF